MKCMPITLFWALTLSVILAIDNEDVFEARITSVGNVLSSLLKTICFVLRSSGTASMTSFASLQLSKSCTAWTEAEMLSKSNLVILPFWTSSSSESSILCTPFLASSIFRSNKKTLYPLWANACAIPEPIVPAPTIQTASIYNTPSICFFDSKFMDRPIQILDERYHYDRNLFKNSAPVYQKKRVCLLLALQKQNILRRGHALVLRLLRYL